MDELARLRAQLKAEREEAERLQSAIAAKAEKTNAKVPVSPADKLRAELQREKEKAAALEAKLAQKSVKQSNRISLLLDEDLESSTADDDENPIEDVMANLAALSTAAGVVEITEDGEDVTHAERVAKVTAKIPEDSKVLGRTLGRSVRNGQLNKNRALAAAKWVDKEIRKLIDLIKSHGESVGNLWTIKFGKLFKISEDVMEAVAGTLKTAKKHKVVKYEAELLMQGASDNIDIVLLKEEIEDSTIDTYTYRQIRACSIKTHKPRKGKSFESGTLQGANSKCAVCGKTVYAMEFVGASGKAYHKNCFRCKTCNGLLRSDNFATLNDVNYCKTHYTELYNKTGGYDFGEKSKDASSDLAASTTRAPKLSLTVGGDTGSNQVFGDSATDVPPIPEEVHRASEAIDSVLTTIISITEADDEGADAPTATSTDTDSLKDDASKSRPSSNDTETRAESTDNDSEPDEELAKAVKPAIMKRKLGHSVRKGEVSKESAMVAVQWVDNEVRKLAKFLKKHGNKNDTGKFEMKFGDICELGNDLFESLTGTLRTCKKNKVVAFGTPMLMKGVHDNVVITLLVDDNNIPEPNLDTYSFKQIRQVSGKHFRANVGSPALPRKIIGTSTVDEPKPDIPKKPKWKISFSPFGKKKKKVASTSSTGSPLASPAGSPAGSPALRRKPMKPHKPDNLKNVKATKAAVDDVMATLVTITTIDLGDEDENTDSIADSTTDDQIPEEEEVNIVTKKALMVSEDNAILSRNLGQSVRRGELNAKRAAAAAKWVDKEIRKLIDLIKTNGTCTDGKYSIKFGVLFKLAEDIMEAVAGTLKTAKKHKVVSYEAELLFQGASDDIDINLLKETIQDSTIDTYTYRQIRACSTRGPRKGKAFGAGTLQGTNSKCAVCGKTVYAMEFVGASGKAYHKNCFRCKTCNGLLRSDNFATLNDVNYCKTHYTELYNKTGGYDFGEKDSAIA